MIINIVRPDDWHLHLRDGELLIDTVNASASSFARALVMPNLLPPLIDIPSLLAYRERLLSALLPENSFYPFMTLYLQEQTKAETFLETKKHNFILGAKLYPANATTHSSAGVQSIKALYPLLDIMQELDLVLQIHGEDTQFDIFEREQAFIENTLTPLIKNFPKLRIVLEHISTQAAVDFVFQAPEHVGATITPQHLLYDRNDLLSNGIKPHLYCLPILKKQEDKKALLRAALSGNPKFFAGTDSAPHAIHHKEAACGCAGTFSAPYAAILYTEIFESHGMLDKLEAFVSKYGALFYRQPLNSERLILKRQPQTVPTMLPLGKHHIVPLKAGEQLSWRIIHDDHSL